MDELSQLKLEKLFEFRLVDKADGTHSVDGIATSEAVDKDNEIADYQGTLKAIKAWSDDAIKKTTGNGQEVSLGNIRVQHDSHIIGGKMTAYEPDEAKKWIVINTQPRSAIYDEYILPGYVTAFSIAGGYESRKCNECGADMPGRGNYCAAPCCKKQVVARYIPVISEISYVDNGCNPDACFTHVKANGGVELVKFADLRKAAELRKEAESSRSGLEDTIERVLVKAGLMKDKKTKRVSGKDLPPSAFAYVGDPDDTSTWKLPIHDAAHCRNALARFNQTHDIPASEKAKVKAKILAAAKKFGIEVSEKSAKCVRFALVKVTAEHVVSIDACAIEKAMTAAEETVALIEKVFAEVEGSTKLFKGLYTVSSLADILQSLQYIVASTEHERDYEGDESEVPDDLREALQSLVPIFIAMAAEEANELLTQNQKAANGGLGGKSMETKDADLLKAAKERATELWKKAKSIFHKMAKCHGNCAKSFHKLAEHHEDLADHHAAMCEDGADKAAQAELQKVTGAADFSKLSKSDQAIARVEACEKGQLSKAHKGFAKMAKLHGHIAKCMTKAGGHHEDLDKAAVDVGDAEDSIDMQNREHDDADAHAGGSSEKTATEQIAELQKQLKELQDKNNAAPAAAKGDDGALDKVLTAIGVLAKSIDAVKKDVDENLSKLTPTGTAAGRGAAGNRLALDPKHKSEDENADKNADNPLMVGKRTASKGRGIFA